MNRFVILIAITFVVCGQKSIKSEIHTYPLSHRIRHQNHHHIQNNNISNIYNNNNNNNVNSKRFIPHLWKTFDKRNYDNSEEELLTSDNKNNGNEESPNSMEFIGVDDDRMKNSNSEYSVNSESREMISTHSFHKKHPSNNNKNNNINNELIHDSSKSNSSSDKSDISGVKCPKCSGSTNVRVSEEELIELRIEFVKNQILQKLRLKEKPQVSTSGLPKLIYEGTQIIQNNEKTASKDLDDYYARTSQKFIFLEHEKKECYPPNQYPSMCFQFKINGDVDGIDVNTAELWVYKKQGREDKMKQTFVVSEVYQGMNSKYLPKAKPIAIQSTDIEKGWIKFDIAWPTRKWYGNHDLNHIIEVSCQSCEPDIKIEDLISVEKDYTPFIVIDAMNRRQRRRQKRSVNCTAGVTECCREKLYISFEEIGWDDWIIQPSGYNAYFCRGSCSSAASITMSSTHHSSFLRKVIYQRETSGKKPLELIPCCTAKQFSSLQLFYRDSNNTATLKTLPNMVVESCGCM